MVRKARIEFAGAVYHVISRGDRGEAIYQDDEDQRLFLQFLGEVCERTGWLIHAFISSPPLNWPPGGFKELTPRDSIFAMDSGGPGPFTTTFSFILLPVKENGEPTPPHCLSRL